MIPDSPRWKAGGLVAVVIVVFGAAAYLVLATPLPRVIAGRPAAAPRLGLAGAARPGASAIASDWAVAPGSAAATPAADLSASAVATELTTPARLGTRGQPRMISSVPAAGKRVALTFDLCEEDDKVAGYDKAVVDVLAKRGVKATFFMGGKWAESHSREAAFLGSQPQFEIGSHSWSHMDLSKATPTQIDEQVVRAQTAIAARTGRTPELFRLPFGFGGPDVVKRIGSHGLWTIQWDVVTGDPDPDFRTKQIMIQVRENLDDGSIIIMHANGNGKHTAEALPAVLDYLKSKGYEIVTVGELMEYL